MFNRFARKKRTKRRYRSLAATLARWNDLNSQLDAREDGKKRTRKVPALGSNKGCMKGKGGPEILNFNYQGVRQRTLGKWAGEIREPDCAERIWLETFSTSRESEIAYDGAARAMYGPSDRRDFPQCNSASRDFSSTPSVWLSSPQCNTASRDSSLTSESSVCAMASHNASVSAGDSKLTAPEVEAVDGMLVDNRHQNAWVVEDPELSLTEVEQAGKLGTTSAVEGPELGLTEVENVDKMRSVSAVEDPDLSLAEVEQVTRLQNTSAIEDPELSHTEVEQVDDIELDDKWLADEALTWAVKREQDVMSLVASKKHHERPLEAADILDIDEMLKLIHPDATNGSSAGIGPKISLLRGTDQSDQKYASPPPLSFQFEKPDSTSLGSQYHTQQCPPEAYYGCSFMRPDE